jgi:addiction module HigA family antidote
MKLKPVHPGEVLKEWTAGRSLHEIARSTGLAVSTLSEIQRGRRGITARVAVRLANYFNTSPRFWMNMQVSYELEIEEDRCAKRTSRKKST